MIGIVKKLTLCYHNVETGVFTIDPSDGNLYNLDSLTRTQMIKFQSTLDPKE